MKWYSHKFYRQHLEDIKSFKDDNELRQAFMDWPKVMANRFDRSYPRVGILDLNDLLQEGYVGFYKSWDKLDWEMLYTRPEEEHIGMITNYLKLSIKRHIIRAIARDRETIRIPEGYYLENPYGHSHAISKYNKNIQTDIFLSRTFSSFFLIEHLDRAEEGGNYYADQLNELLNDLMDHMLSSIEKTVLKKFYGIDEAYDKPVSQARIAEYCSKSLSNIQNIKHRALKKLKEKNNLEIIEKKVENLMIN